MATKFQKVCNKLNKILDNRPENREEFIDMINDIINKEVFDWKDAKKELPKECCHYPELWCSQQVLTRKKFKTKEGIERYHYEVCMYNFDHGGSWMIMNDQNKFYEPDEWCELQIFV